MPTTAIIPIVLTIFLFGLSIGSFLNVLIYRLPSSLKITGRSFCPKCKKKISWYDNIPLISFFALGSKCRFCHSLISWQYPLIEFITGILFLLVAVVFLEKFGIFVVLGYWLVVSTLIVIFFIDLKHQIIPDVMVFPAIPVTLLLSSGFNVLIPSLLSGIGASFFFLLLHLITKGKGMGLGDVKFVFLMGLILGFPKIITALYLAFLTGALVGVILVLIRGKKLNSHLPFGPFLVFATFLVMFLGEEINKWITFFLF